jgi:hypothetical protein
MLRRHAAVLLTMIVLTAPPATADPSAFAFLEVPAGARASAMGGAFVAGAEGADAAFWNPAGLAAVNHVEITGSHFELYQNLRHDQFAIAGHWLGGGVAGSLRALYTDPIAARDELGNLTGTFGGNDLDFSFAYGRAVSEGLRAGASFHLVRSRLAELSTGTYAFGGGVTWDAPGGLSPLRLGAALDHVGPAARYDFGDGVGQPMELPTALQLGGWYHWSFGHGMSVGSGLEARMSRGRPVVGSIGGELNHSSGAVLRLGARINDDVSTFSVGAGYTMSAIRLDYAFVPYSLDLGDSHRISFTAHF